jgi:hypothetical protein
VFKRWFSMLFASALIREGLHTSFKDTIDRSLSKFEIF